MENNSLQLKVALRVNDSLPDLRRQIDLLESKLRNVKLNATIDVGKSVELINNKIDKLSNSAKVMRIMADIDYNKSKNKISNSMKKLAENSQVDVKVNAKVDTQSVKSGMKQAQNIAKSTGKIDLFDVESFKKKMELAVKQLQLSKSHKFKSAELDSFLSAVNNISQNTPNARQEMSRLNLQLKEISVNAKRVDSSMATALKGISLWTIASTSFFAPIKLLQNMSEEILTVDKSMTELKRVMDGTPQQYNSMLQESINMSKELGTNVHEVMQSLNEVARSYGDLMSQQDLLALTKTSTIAANVSDLSAEDAMKSLIGTMNAYKISASDSIQIVDKMNEVDNNYSISTQQIAEAMQKASGVAKVYGVSIEELIGNITGIGSVTMEAGSQIGRSLKTIYSRVTTLSEAKDALSAVGVSVYDMQGQVKPVSKILDELAGKWNSLSDEERQNTAVHVAGRDMLTRMIALMENYSTSVSATETAMNSQNSSITENLKFQDSMEARINKLKTSFTELSLAVGDAVLKDGMIMSIDSLTEMTKSISDFVNKVGVLTPLLGTLGVGIGMLSKNARTMSTAIFMGTKSMDSAKASSVGLSAGMSQASVATRLLSTAFKGLMASTGVGLLLAGIGFVAEKLITSMASAKQKTEEFQQQQKQALDTYSQNKDSLSGLVDEYDKLDKKLSSGKFSDEDLKKHRDVAREISTLMPDMIIAENQYGEKIIGSSERIRAKTELLEKQLQVQERIDAVQNQEKAQENFDVAKKSLNKSESKLADMNGGISTNVGVQQIEDIIKKYEVLQKKIASGKKLTFIQQNDFDFYKGNIDEFEKIKSEVDSARLAYQQALMEMISTNIKLDSSTSAMTKSLISDFTTFIATADGASDKTINKIFDDLLDKTQNSSEFKKAMESYSTALSEFQDKISSGNYSVDDLKEYEKESTTAFENVKKQLLSLNGMKDLDSDALNKIVAQLTSTSDASYLASVDIDKLAKSSNKTTDEIREMLGITDDASDSIEQMGNSAGDTSNDIKDLNDTIDKQIEKLKELNSAQEVLVGVSSDQISTVADQSLVMQELSNKSEEYAKKQEEVANNTKLSTYEQQKLSEQLQLTTAEQNALNYSTQLLCQLYPELASMLKGTTQERNRAIGMIQLENQAHKELMDAIEMQKNGQLNAEQQRMLGKAQATNTNIENIKKEILALQELVDAYALTAKNIIEANPDFKKPISEGGGMQALSESDRHALESLNQYSSRVQNGELKEKINTLSSLQSQLSGQTGRLTTSIQKNTTAKSKNNKETSKSIYVTDKYSQAMGKLNNQYDKLENKLKRYTEYSSNYRKILKEQIKLREKEIKTTKDQYNLLNKQIKSGKIAKSGSFTLDSSKISSGSLGYKGRYADTINKYAKQYKVNPNLIAGMIKQESGFNPNAISPAGARGLMQLMPATAKGLGVTNSFNPDQNIAGGTKYIAQMLKKYNGDVEKALRAYNAGSGNLAKSYGFAETNKYVKNVTANFNDYLKKASGSIAKVSKSTIKTMGDTAKQSVTRKLAGWNGQVTQNFGNNGHRGMDIDGKIGDRLDSNVNGSVSFAGKGTGSAWSYGNYIVIKGKDGKEYRYAHLDSVNVKAGQKVSIGDKIGAIGNTGNVVKGANGDGSHLHYEVLQNGKLINPYSSAMGAKGIKTVSASTGEYYDSSKQAVDEAKQTLLELDNLISDKTADIAELRQAIIESKGKQYEHVIEVRQSKVDNRAITKERSTGDSEWYRKAITRDINDTKYMQKKTKKELNYYQKMVKGKGLTQAEKATYNNKIRELRQSVNQYANDLIDYRIERVNSRGAKYESRIEERQSKIDVRTASKERSTGDTSWYRRAVSNDIRDNKANLKDANAELKMYESKLKEKGISSKEKKEYKENIRRLRQSIGEYSNNIVNGYIEQSDSKMNQFDYRVTKIDRKISLQENLQGLMNNTSKQYTDSLKEQEKLAKDKQKTLQSEYNYAVQQSKNARLGSVGMRKQKEKADEIANALIDNQKSLADIAKRTSDIKINQLDDKLSGYDYLLQRSQAYGDSLLENNSDKYSEMGNQIDVMRQIIETMQQKSKELLASLSDPKLKYEDKVVNRDAYMQNELAITQMQANIRNMYQQTADYVIDLYKKVYEKRREMELKAIDDERKRYQKLINDKISALQKLNQEEDYNDERDDYQKRIAELEKRIKQFTGDDSNLGTYEKKKAEEELEELKKEYQKFIRDHDTDKTIEGWQDDLDNKEKELDDATDATNKYYDNLVNDERAFGKIRAEILRGNVDTFKKELSGMSEFISGNMGDIGTSISESILDQIKIAVQQLGVAGDHDGADGGNTVSKPPTTPPDIKDNFTPEAPKSEGSTSTKTYTTTQTKNLYTHANTSSKVITTIPKGTKLNVLGQSGNFYKVDYKFNTGYVLFKSDKPMTGGGNASAGIGDSGASASVGSGGVSATTKKTNADAGFFTKADDKSTRIGTIGKDSNIVYKGSSGNYAKVEYNGKTGYIFKKHLVGLDTGGMIVSKGAGIDGKGGRIGMLHPDEVVNNPIDTKRLLQASEIIKDINLNDVFRLPKIETPTLQSPNKGVGDMKTDIQINVASMNGTEQDLNKMVNLVAKRVQEENMKTIRKSGYRK